MVSLLFFFENYKLTMETHREIYRVKHKRWAPYKSLCGGSQRQIPLGTSHGAKSTVSVELLFFSF